MLVLCDIISWAAFIAVLNIMDDDFYEPQAINPSASLMSRLWTYPFSVPTSVLTAILIAPLAIVVATRYLSERPSRASKGGSGRTTVWLLPYWFPGIGHAFSLYVSYSCSSWLQAADSMKFLWPIQIDARSKVSWETSTLICFLQEDQGLEFSWHFCFEPWCNYAQCRWVAINSHVTHSW